MAAHIQRCLVSSDGEMKEARRIYFGATPCLSVYKDSKPVYLYYVGGPSKSGYVNECVPAAIGGNCKYVSWTVPQEMFLWIVHWSAGNDTSSWVSVTRGDERIVYDYSYQSGTSRNLLVRAKKGDVVAVRYDYGGYAACYPLGLRDHRIFQKDSSSSEWKDITATIPSESAVKVSPVGCAVYDVFGNWLMTVPNINKRVDGKYPYRGDFASGSFTERGDAPESVEPATVSI